MSGYFETLRDEIEPLLPVAPAVVMDIGCGAGVTSQWLKKIRPNIITVGVEIDAVVAAAAASVVDSVLVVDIEKDMAALGGYVGGVDLLLLLDVLEHLRDPWSRLKELKSLMTPAGVVIASIPNVRNLKVLVPLLMKGEWHYQSAGILDRTHLRFFTRRSVTELFQDAGFDIQTIAVTGPLKATGVKSLAGKIAYLTNLLLAGLLTDFMAHQYVVRAVVSTAADGPPTPVSR